MKIIIPMDAEATARSKAINALNAAMQKAVAAAGFTKTYVNTKSGVFVSLLVHSGEAFDHSVPLAKRGPDKKAPKYYTLSFNLQTSGETNRHTSDGPIGAEKTYASHSVRFDTEPTAAEIKAAMPEMNAALKKANAEFKNLVKKFNAK